MLLGAQNSSCYKYHIVDLRLVALSFIPDFALKETVELRLLSQQLGLSSSHPISHNRTIRPNINLKHMVLMSLLKCLPLN